MWLHLRKLCRTDEWSRANRGSVEGDDIRFLEELIKRKEPHASTRRILRGHRRIGSEEDHAKCRSARGNGSADPSETDDAKPPTTKFEPLELGARPCPVAH
jgi:hypothetical protein